MNGLITNKAHQTNWRLDIPDGNDTISFVIAVQSATIPMFEIEPVMIPVNPMTMGQIPGSAARFEPLNMRLLVDENLEAYVDIYRWMTSIVDYRDGKSTAHIEGNSPRAILLHMLDNSKTKIVLTFKFVGAWPSSLGNLEYVYNEEGNNPIICDVMFMFKYFEVIKDDVVIGPRFANPNSTRAAKASMMSMHPSMR